MAHTTLILGASRGIGLELAHQSLAAGERVIATARDDAGLERLRALGCQPLRLDVTDPAAIDGCVPPRQEHWRLQLDADTCWWGRPGRPSFEVHYSSVADASGKIQHPAL